jgi:glycosyltransferase involved in cell wall biosynthesis
MPDYSFVIPVYNDPAGLSDTLDSILNMDFDLSRLQVIVADNGSRDNTLSTARRYAEKHPQLIEVVVEDQIQGSYAARNKGIEKVRGRIVCFLDADVKIMPDYISKVDRYFSDDHVDYLGANVQMEVRHGTLAEKYNSLHGFNIKVAIERDHYTPTCHLAIRKSVLDKVGHFDNRLEGGGDFEFGERVFEAGYKMRYADDLLVVHPARKSFRALVKKSERVGRGNAQLAYFYPDKYKYIYDRHFSWKLVKPRNMFTFYKEFKHRKIPIGLTDALILALYPIPIRLAGAWASWKEARRLNKTNNFNTEEEDI